MLSAVPRLNSGGLPDPSPGTGSTSGATERAAENHRRQDRRRYGAGSAWSRFVDGLGRFVAQAAPQCCRWVMDEVELS
jgi:hypothetical protein